MSPLGLLRLLLNPERAAPGEKKQAKPHERIVGEPETLPHGWVDYRFASREKFPRGAIHGVRDWSKITGIVLHQTATDGLRYDHPKILGVPAHALIDPQAYVVALRPLQAYMFHAHALNEDTLGLEIDCKAAGIESDPRTWPKGRREATEAQIVSALDWCFWVIDTVHENGGRIERVWAHRQGRRSRVADPGSRIWQRVAIPLEDIGVVTAPLLTRGSGKRIADAWDPGTGVDYNWRIKAKKK
jgi:hypothetical protein